jgi:Secretion system C-terminal sorting domain
VFKFYLSGFVILKIYDILGNEVKTLVSEQKSVGSYNINFDASGLASGFYIYRLTANNFVSTKKMLMIK